MSFRFWRRIEIAPGVTLNLSKSGASLSFGPRGAKLTIGPKGKRATVGLPGTGLFYTTTLPEEKQRSDSPAPDAPPVRPEDRLSLGFFQRLLTPDDEKGLMDGCRALVQGHEERAFEHLRKSIHLADGAYLAGFLALKRNRLEEAVEYLSAAADQHSRLGRYFSKYGISATMSLPITDELSAHVGPDLRGVLLGLVEAHQRLGQTEEATACLERLLRLEPDDLVVRLSLAELLLDQVAEDGSGGGLTPEQRAAVCRRVIRLAEGVENETEIHAALLLYKARALRELGLLEAARTTLTAALRRKKGRPAELLRALRYERGRVYEGLGQRRKARAEFERLYAEDPGYEDVAARLGLSEESR